jgi:tetratricopeptide (TPR) repeat protein
VLKLSILAGSNETAFQPRNAASTAGVGWPSAELPRPGLALLRLFGASPEGLGPLIYPTSWLGWANYMLKRYGEAVRLLRECTSNVPNLQWPHLMLAAAYAQSGQLEEARKEAAEVPRINPGFTIERYKRLILDKDPKDVEHRTDGMRKAGLPES